MYGRTRAAAFALLLVSLFTLEGNSPTSKSVKVKFTRPDLVSYDKDGFNVRGKGVVIYSGSFHYFRCDSSDWQDRLQKIKAAGFNTVETYVAWNWHEREEGKVDLNELDKFLTECEQLGFYVIVRPGPYICAEWDVGGFPEWLAGKGVDFRSASTENLKWSAHWYNEVLPVIRRHLITNGGSIIMVQIENEYDYFGLADSDKTIYLKSLYNDALRNGIDVPIITCWTRQTRDKSDSLLSQILDACNFYPAWDIKSTLPAIEKDKADQPDAPPMITELQGGWFSSVGDSSVRLVDRYGPEQVNDLTNFVLAHGEKAINYYMLYGGTNFGYWGSKGKTTSYDYAAPISEPGGLWSKYRAVKLIGDFIRLGGEYLAKAHEVKGGAATGTKGVETLLRSDGKVSFLYVWNTTDKNVEASVDVNAPRSSPFTLTIQMRARESYFLPVNYPLPGGTSLRYTTAQIASISAFDGKPLIIAYGNPGDDVLISLEGSMNIVKVKSTDQLFQWEGVYVLLTSKDRASRSCVLDGGMETGALISDSYLVLPDSHEGKTVSLEFQSRSGDDAFTLVTKSQISDVKIDGKAVQLFTDPKTGVISFSAKTPQSKATNIPITDIRVSADPESDATLTALNQEANIFPALQSLGNFQNGYTVYKGRIEGTGKKDLRFRYYDNDWHSVIIDDKPVPALSSADDEDNATVDLAPGSHNIAVIYENQGRPNGSFMEQSKGLESVSSISDRKVIELNSWKYSPSSAPYPGKTASESEVAFDDSKWPVTKVGAGPQSFMEENSGRWFRTTVQLTENELAENPKVCFDGVDDDAIIYANGKLLGEHHGWDTRFSFELVGVAQTGANAIAIYVQNFGGPGGIYKPAAFELGAVEKVAVTLGFHPNLNGSLSGWQSPGFDDSKWRNAPRWETVPSWDGISWYRGKFNFQNEKNWVTPLALHIESTGDMQIWLNGKLLGRYFAAGPQKDFYIPSGWLNADGKNNISLVLRPAAAGKIPPIIKSVYVSPYKDYNVQKHSMVITFR